MWKEKWKESLGRKVKVEVWNEKWKWKLGTKSESEGVMAPGCYNSQSKSPGEKCLPLIFFFLIQPLNQNIKVTVIRMINRYHYHYPKKVKYMGRRQVFVYNK